MVWLIYNLLFTIALTAALPYYLLRMWRRGGYSEGFGQRFGWYGESLRRRIAEKPRIWVHAVSVGEVSVALRLIGAWRKKRPGDAFVLSTNTSTAHELARRSLDAADVLIYFPIDFPPVLKRVADCIRPRMLVLTEGEWWPNLIRLVHSRNVPIAVINGRMSEPSFRGYYRMRWFFSGVMRMADLICAQSREDADRLLRMGADPARVFTTGSAKYDAAGLDPESGVKAAGVLRAAGLDPAGIFLLGGSTWPGEEAIMLDAYMHFKTSYPELRLILVPRHAERRGEVMSEIQSRGLKAVQRSRMAEVSGPSGPPDVLLVDTTGELKHFFAVATVIFMGKSLTEHGGQNVIEPAACGKPIIVGPNNENFREVIADFVASDAIIQVQNASGLVQSIGELLPDPQLREEYGGRAMRLVMENRGSMDKTLTLIEGIL
jgi:3-deoxy-D-manno-octulosonic-acid transferase